MAVDRQHRHLETESAACHGIRVNVAQFEVPASAIQCRRELGDERVAKTAIGTGIDEKP